jgi:hypothetical protein
LPIFGEKILSGHHPILPSRIRLEDESRETQVFSKSIKPA